MKETFVSKLWCESHFPGSPKFKAVSDSQNILWNACTVNLLKTLDFAILSFAQARLTDNTWLLILSSVSHASSTEPCPPFCLLLPQTHLFELALPGITI